MEGDQLVDMQTDKHEATATGKKKNTAPGDAGRCSYQSQCKKKHTVRKGDAILSKILLVKKTKKIPFKFQFQLLLLQI